MRAALVALALALGACAGGGEADMSDWERAHAQRELPAEEALALPPYPKDADLIAFEAPDVDRFRFFVDGATLRAGKDGIVRYVLVARSPQGARNVTYEGLRCATGEQRIFAIGQADRSWVLARGEWRRVVQPRHVTLYRDYFCPQNEPIRSADEGRRALEQGGHPFAKGFGSEFGKGR